ncbi:Signal transduction histidine kinase CheA [hydrothermal vent metagenome]|uniref:Chemotaxis protein CheA n=1 Tax=hydrothermal vent metagenome TaxID=652676 RepID=A0A3B0Z0Z5_9ZZZZ
MSIDMSQFLQTFYEESFEGLEIMESELLDLNVKEYDPETINTIFRAAHSMKGGSGTFGLNEVAAFTHILETLLDEVREGVRPITLDMVEVLLRSVDELKAMLQAAQAEEDFDMSQVEIIKRELTAFVSAQVTVEEPTNIESKEVTLSLFTIVFRPHLGLLVTGNDPIRLFAELEELGTLTVVVDAKALPELETLEPDECHLAWTITLETEASQAEISSIFDWVEDDCDLTISSEAVVAVDSQQSSESPNDPSIVASIDSKVTPQSASAATQTDNASDNGQAKKPKTVEQTSIRVGIDKVDSLINMVGELVITQSMLGQLGKDFDMSRVERLVDGLAQLERNTRELQESVMRIRMLPISFAFNRFPRLIHDLNLQLGKKINLKILGESTELDKTVLEKIVDPLVHLVRNSVDHGIEQPDVRVAKGKPEAGEVSLNAYHKGGNIVIEIIDDGAGLNRGLIRKKAIEKNLVTEDEELSDDQVYDLIFRAGFSTADVVSDVSGRGVGMDVVRRNIRELQGAIDVSSVPDQGSKFTIRLPLTLAIMDGQLIRVGDETYIIPLVSIIESLQIKKEQINSIAGRAELYKLRDDYIEIVRLYKSFSIKPDNTELEEGLLVVVEAEGKKVGVLVDDLLDQQQVVIKSLETNFRKVEGMSGATILGDGTVAMILDIQGLISLAHNSGRLEESNKLTEVA